MENLALLPFLGFIAGSLGALIGAGGAARAVAFVMADEIGQSGHITIVNRTTATAAGLAAAVYEAYGNTSSAPESGLASAIADADLVINASTRGQSGLRSQPDDQTTCLEPYSSLAPCNPASLSQEQYADNSLLMRAWYQASLKDIAENQSRSAQAVLSAGGRTRFYDIVYAPLETAMLRQARLAGYETLNGNYSRTTRLDGLSFRVPGPQDDELLEPAVRRLHLRVRDSPRPGEQWPVVKISNSRV